MPNVYKPGLLQIRPQYTVNTDTSEHPENVTWWVSGSALTPPLSVLQAIQDVFDPLWGALWSYIGPTNRFYTGSVVTDWSSATGEQADSVGIFTPVPGIQTGESLPPQIAVLNSYAIGLRYKGGHPRTYFPWVADAVRDATDPSKLQGGVPAGVTARTGAVWTGMEGSGINGGQTPVAYLHRNSVTLASIHPLVNILTQTTFATQRRRIRRVAHH